MSNNSRFLSDRVAVCPPDLLHKASTLPTPRVAIAGAGSELPMHAAMEGSRAGLMQPLFCGNTNHILEHADRLEWDISNFEIEHADDEAEAATDE